MTGSRKTSIVGSWIEGIFIYFKKRRKARMLRNIDFEAAIESISRGSKTWQAVAGEYGSCATTLHNRIEESGLYMPPGKLLFPNDLKLIYYKLGVPKAKSH